MQLDSQSFQLFLQPQFCIFRTSDGITVFSMADKPHFLRNIPIAWEGEAAPEVPEFPPALEIGAQAVSSAILGGINGILKEGMTNYQDLQNGKLDQKQFTYRLVRKGSQAAFQSGSKAVAALTMRQGMVYAAKKMGSKSLLGLARRHTMVSVCYGIVDQSIDTVKFYRGELDTTGFKIQTSENVGSTGGAIGGAALGAALGSVVPGLGTMAGALLGMLGAASGASVGKSVGEKWFGEDNNSENPPASPKE